VIPVSAITISGSASNRAVQFLPATNQFGTSTITLWVSDGSLTNKTSFLVSVNPVNDAPFISSIAPQTVNEDTPTALVPFTVWDVESPVSNLLVTASSSNPTLIPPNALFIAGNGSNRTVKVVPATNQFGTATVTLAVNDGNLSTFSSFLLTINPINDRPTISSFKDLTIAKNGIAGPITFIIGDPETSADKLLLSGSSSNPYIVPQYGITFGGSLSNRTLTLNPAHGRTGKSHISIQVSDGSLITSNSFYITVGSTGLSGVNPSDGQILGADLYQTSLTISWATFVGGAYRLLSAPTLGSTNWTPVAADFVATDIVTSWQGTITNAHFQFFKIQKMQ
jgi:hypothetical protein